MKKGLSALLFLFLFLHVKAQSPLSGIWENGSRFVQFYDNEQDINGQNMRIVLKPYYRFVYEAQAVLSASFETEKQINGRDFAGVLSIKYPYEKKTFSQPIFISSNNLFTSFYKKEKAEKEEAEIPAAGLNEDKNSPLYGFWIEQGYAGGVMLYPAEPIKSFNAYFFYSGRYIKFRYWYDDLVYSDKKAFFDTEEGRFRIPKMIKRGNRVYSCITNIGSVLRNYEKGYYKIEKSDAENGSFFIFINKDGAGPGKNAEADTLPDYLLKFKESIAVHFSDSGLFFAMGEPYLIRSAVINLDKEIEAHNKKRKKPREPDIVDDDLDYNWEEAKRLQKLN